MKNPIIIANLRYIDPKRKGRGHGNKGLRSILKYLQHRDDRQGYIPAENGERWVDRGLGLHYREILKNCAALKSTEVLAWTYVISPAPDLMALIPENQRHEFIQELTESVIERYYDERGCTAPYSYIVHEAQTQDGRLHTHTHIILPGTAEDYLEGWQPFKNYRNKGHLKLLDDIATEEFTLALNQTIGIDWQHGGDLLVATPEI